MKFVDLGDLKQCKVLCFSDASYRNLPDEGSQGSYIIFLCNQQDTVVPIQLQSEKVRRVVRSTLVAECLAQLDAIDASFLIKSSLEELFNCNNGIPVESIIDNKSLCEALYSTKCIEDKRLRVDVAILRERVTH